MKFSFGSKICQSYGKLKQLNLMATCRAGYMAGSNIELQDKFYLGGPLDIKGFDLNRASPASGGNGMVAVGAHVFYPMPFVGSEKVNLHGFLTTGSVFSNPKQIEANVKTSAGLGLQVNIMPEINLDLHYARRADGQGKVGFGIGFATL